MKYFKLEILTLDLKARKVLARVDGHYVQGKETYFFRMGRNNRNNFYPEGTFFDFLSVDDTINLGMRVRNFTLHDAMAWFGERPGGQSFIVSPKLRTLLEGFKLADSCFYGAKLRSKYLFYDYNVVQFIEDKYIELSNLPECVFTRGLKNIIVPNTEEYKISSIDELESIRNKIFEDLDKLEKIETETYSFPSEYYLSIPYQVLIKKLVFKKECKGIDLMWCTFFNSYIISGKLKEALEANNITGIEIKEITDVEIVVED